MDLAPRHLGSSASGKTGIQAYNRHTTGIKRWVVGAMILWAAACEAMTSDCSKGGEARHQQPRRRQAGGGKRGAFDEWWEGGAYQH